MRKHLKPLAVALAVFTFFIAVLGPAVWRRVTSAPGTPGATAHQAVTAQALSISNRASPNSRRTPLAGRCPVTAVACVDLSTGTAWIQKNGRVTYGPVPMASGRAGHPTPRGDFKVQWKARHWTSTIYHLPMPYSVFFAAGGIAFHEGPVNRPSHGCIHLQPTAALRFYQELPVGSGIHVA